MLSWGDTQCGSCVILHVSEERKRAGGLMAGTDELVETAVYLCGDKIDQSGNWKKGNSGSVSVTGNTGYIF